LSQEAWIGRWTSRRFCQPPSGREVGQRAAPAVLELDQCRTARPCGDGLVATAERLQLGLLVGADHQVLRSVHQAGDLRRLVVLVGVLVMLVAPQATLVDGGKAVDVAVTVTCPTGGVVLEASCT
jgi:hypothetical protein